MLGAHCGNVALSVGRYWSMMADFYPEIFMKGAAKMPPTGRDWR
ncbi:hypothetical protein PATSB16_34860 [Pandoraea thiooxydans]|nr:hypothetical protein PATSB16_34860 [Pandoraea thiooxydans]